MTAKKIASSNPQLIVVLILLHPSSPWQRVRSIEPLEVYPVGCCVRFPYLLPWQLPESNEFIVYFLWQYPPLWLIVACILFFLTTHFSACILIDCRMISCDFQCHSCSIFSFGGYNISSWPRAIIRSLVDGLSDGSAKDSGTVNSANAAASCRRIRPGDGSVWRLAIPWRPPWFRQLLSTMWLMAGGWWLVVAASCRTRNKLRKSN